MHYHGIDDMNHAIIRGIQQIPPDVDVIVGTPQSVLPAAVMLSLLINRPPADVDGLAERRLFPIGKRFLSNIPDSVFDSSKRIPIVDDWISHGTEIKRTRADGDSISWRVVTKTTSRPFDDHHA